ncbi:MAG: hypothetical protein AAGC44_16135 [Planctomycetota bacterium]
MDSDLIGQILVQQGVLTTEQVEQVVLRQTEREQPFGRIAQELFGISEACVLSALAEQVALRSPDASLATETFDPQVLRLISAKDAWDRLILPIRWDDDGELLVATTEETLPAAIELLSARLDVPFHFAIAEMRPLEEFIANLYAYEGVEVID